MTSNWQHLPPEVLRQLLLEQRRTGRLPVAGLRTAGGIGNVAKAPRINAAQRQWAPGKSGFGRLGTVGSPTLGAGPSYPDDPSVLPPPSPTPSPPPPSPGPQLAPGAPQPSNPALLAGIQQQMTGLGMDPTTAIYSPAPPNIQGPQPSMIQGPGNIPKIPTVTPTGIQNIAPSPLVNPAAQPDNRQAIFRALANLMVQERGRGGTGSFRTFAV